MSSKDHQNLDKANQSSSVNGSQDIPATAPEGSDEGINGEDSEGVGWEPVQLLEKSLVLLGVRELVEAKDGSTKENYVSDQEGQA